MEREPADLSLRGQGLLHFELQGMGCMGAEFRFIVWEENLRISPWEGKEIRWNSYATASEGKDSKGQFDQVAVGDALTSLRVVGWNSYGTASEGKDSKGQFDQVAVGMPLSQWGCDSIYRRNCQRCD